MPDPLTILSGISAGAGLLGSIFGGGERAMGREAGTVTTSRRSPELMQALEWLRQMYQQGINVPELKRTARERGGYEGSAMRQAALSRLRRGNAPAPVIEQVLSGMGVDQMRAIEEALANIEVQGQEFRLKPLSIFGQLASDMDVTQTSDMTQYGGGGQMYSSLLGTGLYGLMSNPHFNDLFKKKNNNPLPETTANWRAR